MSVKIWVAVFWVVTLCTIVVGYHHYKGPCSASTPHTSHHSVGGASKVLQNIDILLHYHTVSQSRRPQLELFIL